MAFNDRASPLTLLATRRSGKPKELVAPGPDALQLHAMAALAARTPDHGKLAPWRFVIVPDAARATLGERMAEALKADQPGAGDAVLQGARDFATQAPALVVVLSSPAVGAKIPVWEQELSAGAACMNLLHAGHAMGFAGGWLTGWAAYSDRVRDLFGAAPERIAGFLFFGTPERALSERPRGVTDATITTWKC